jgi:tetratricopeptide (TPR) repeat protein
LIGIIDAVEAHPLAIRALAGAVTRSRSARGSLSVWLADNPGFHPSELELVQSRSHVLAYAMREVGARSLFVLAAIAAFRRPPSFEALAELSVGSAKATPTVSALDAVLEELEGRGLIGWDRQNATFDMHPIVRGVVWRRVGQVGRELVIQAHNSYFERTVVRDGKVASDGGARLDSLVQYFFVLLELGRLGEAFALLADNFFDDAVYRHGFAHESAEMLEALFKSVPEGGDAIFLPLGRDDAENLAGVAYARSGRDEDAQRWFRAALARRKASPGPRLMDGSLLANSALSELAVGRLYDAFSTSLASLEADLKTADPSYGLYTVGRVLLALGYWDAARRCLRRAMQQPRDRDEVDTRSFSSRTRLYAALACDERGGAERQARRCSILADQARRIAVRNGLTADRLAADVLIAALAARDHGSAEARTRLWQLLEEARRHAIIDVECSALIALARSEMETGDPGRARALLDEVLAIPEDYQLRVLRAEAALGLTRASRLQDDRGGIHHWGERTMELAWCDGPPFCLQPIVAASRLLLQEAGFRPTERPPFSPRGRSPILRLIASKGLMLPPELLAT